MNKKERIERYGEAAYKKFLEQTRQWQKQWRETKPEEVDKCNHKVDRIGGKYYEWTLKYNRTGLRGKRSRIRATHGKEWRQFKKIIAPDSQLHHQWHPGTSRYDGVALVETDQHQHGIIDVIEILEGAITVFTEKELHGGLEQ